MPSIKKARCTQNSDATSDVSLSACTASVSDQRVSTVLHPAPGIAKRKWKSFPTMVAARASVKKHSVIPFDGVALTLITDASHTEISLPVKRDLDESDAAPYSTPTCSPTSSHISQHVKIDDSAAISNESTAPVLTCPPVLKQHPPSPSQREAFQASLYVTKVKSNLSTANAAPGARVNFDGTVVVVYPCEANPVRRYVLLADELGTIGVTFWNQNVSKFSSSSVGHVVQLTKVLITQHNGKKSITMNKESGLTFTEQIAPFWSELARNPIVSIVDVHSMPANSFVTIAGVLGFLHSERKIVKDQEKELVIMKLIDRTGQIEVQSWVSKLADFSVYRDRPVKFQRLRVVAFGGIKCLEILDGNGTLVNSEFDGCGELAKFWNEPV